MTARLALTVGQSARGVTRSPASRRRPTRSTWAMIRHGRGEGEALELALLALLEKLSATERAAYVLHEAFDCPPEDRRRAWGQRDERPADSDARASASVANDVDGSAPLSTDVFLIPSSQPRRPERSRRSNGCLLHRRRRQSE